MNLIRKVYRKMKRSAPENDAGELKPKFDFSPWFDCHMHTLLCGHATGKPAAYVDRAVELGLGGLCFTCHMPFDDATFGGDRMRMRQADFPAYLDLVAEMQAYGQERGVTVLCGIEGEVFPNPVIQDALGQILASHPFDYVLGSVHHHMPAYQDWFVNEGFETDDELITAYFETLRDAAGTGHFHSLAHPDVIRLYGTLGGDFDPSRHESIIREAIAAAVESDVCWEVNTSGRSKGAMIEHPDPIIRHWGKEMGLKLTIGSDAHAPKTVGRYFETIIPDLASEGFEALHYFIKGERKVISLQNIATAPA